MNDDLDRLLIRAGRTAARRRAGAGLGSPAFVGQVASSGANLAAGKFCLVTPVDVAGAETEGAAGSFATLTGTVPVYVIGTAPANGEKVLVEWADYRWVTEKQPAGGPAPIGIGVPGCLCTIIPEFLSLTLTFGSGETSATYSNAYRPCTLAYYTTPPSYMPQSAFTGAGWYSTAAWIDDQGFTDYFRLTCFASQFTLGFGQNSQGLWQAPGQMYNWSMGGRPAVNTCHVAGHPTEDGAPFALLTGRAQSGIFFNGRIQVVG